MHEPGEITKQSTLLPQLDGLRGVAILLVISFHYYGFLPFFSAGWSGVDLFFVLSGFLITGKLLDSVGQKNYFSHFFRNRVLRIFPLYFLTLLIFMVAVFLLDSNKHIEGLQFYRAYWWSFILFIQNWIFIFIGTGHEKYLRHFWSLAVEEQFYLIWPWIIYFVRDQRKLILLLLSLAPIIILARTYQFNQYPQLTSTLHYNTFFRTDSFIAGALICLATRKSSVRTQNLIKTLFYIALTAILIGTMLEGDANIFNAFFSTIGFSWIAVFYGCFLYLTLSLNQGVLFMLLTMPVLRFCGKISYGLYIFHWPLRLILAPKLNHWWGGIFPTHLSLVHFCVFGVCLFATFCLSYLSFTYYESFFLRLKQQNPKSLIPGRPLSTSAAVKKGGNE